MHTLRMVWGKFKKNKYKNIRVRRAGAGRSFASKLESSVYQILLLRKAAHEILEVIQQVHVRLTDAEIVYITDFKCLTPTGGIFFVEAKGFETPEWKIKKRLWKFYGPAPLEIWMTTPRTSGPILVETIIPRTKK